jgi:hypothetical protein
VNEYADLILNEQHEILPSNRNGHHHYHSRHLLADCRGLLPLSAMASSGHNNLRSQHRLDLH